MDLHSSNPCCSKVIIRKPQKEEKNHWERNIKFLWGKRKSGETQHGGWLFKSSPSATSPWVGCISLHLDFEFGQVCFGQWNVSGRGMTRGLKSPRAPGLALLGLCHPNEQNRSPSPKRMEYRWNSHLARSSLDQLTRAEPTDPRAK